ncbi:MAG: protein kinase domain-containing protein, partial [Armatimonadaceae bacterium]
MAHTDPSATATITPAAPQPAATLSADGTRQMDGSPGSAAHCPSVPGYEILSKLGEGGMADVYLGRDVLLDHRVAIKFIRSVRVTDRVRFLAEAQALASVRHPNVVRVVTFGDAGDTPYLVMEYLAGGSLADRLKSGGRLPIRD